MFLGDSHLYNSERDGADLPPGSTHVLSVSATMRWCSPTSSCSHFPASAEDTGTRRKSDFNPRRLKLIKNGLLPAAPPPPQIVATSLTALVGCMRRARK